MHFEFPPDERTRQFQYNLLLGGALSEGPYNTREPRSVRLATCSRLSASKSMVRIDVDRED